MTGAYVYGPLAEVSSSVTHQGKERMTIPGPPQIASAVNACPEPGEKQSPLPLLQVAVVIVTYKSAQFTIACLQSLVAERSNPLLQIKVIVVDNASGDLAQISRVVDDRGWSSWVTLVESPKNGGFAYGNNLGIEYACAAGAPSYFLLLNPDTEVRPGAVTALVKFLEAHPEVGIAGPSFETAMGDDWKTAFRFPTLLGELEQGLGLGIATRALSRWAVVRHMGDRSEPVDWISGAAMMIRPEVFATVGGMDENYFLFFEETDLCKRARGAGFTTWYVPESRVMHIGGDTTKVRKRRPSYWFESRRRYFAVTYGLAQAMLIDIVALVAHFLGSFKRLIQGRPRSGIPHFIRDLIHHSVIWNRNQNITTMRSRISVGVSEANAGSATVQPSVTVQPRT